MISKDFTWSFLLDQLDLSLASKSREGFTSRININAFYKGLFSSLSGAPFECIFI